MCCFCFKSILSRLIVFIIVHRFLMQREALSFCSKAEKLVSSATSCRSFPITSKSMFFLSQRFPSLRSRFLLLTSAKVRTYLSTSEPQVLTSSFSAPCRFFSSTQTAFLPNFLTEEMSREGKCAKSSDNSYSPSISRSAGRGNFFSFFGFPEDPELNESELQSRYHALQKKVHPDQRCQQETKGNNEDVPESPSNFVSGLFESYSFQEMDPEDRSAAMDSISVYANEGYALLRDPFLRSRYLCKLQSAREEKKKKSGDEKGSSTLSTEEEELLAVDSDSIIRDTCIKSFDEEFLLEMMQMNELIFAGNPSEKEDHARMVALKVDLEERTELLFDLTKKAWKENNFEDLVACVHKWTYLWNALNNLLNRM